MEKALLGSSDRAANALAVRLAGAGMRGSWKTKEGLARHFSLLVVSGSLRVVSPRGLVWAPS